jgi:hypothetical protein
VHVLSAPLDGRGGPHTLTLGAMSGGAGQAELHIQP